MSSNVECDIEIYCLVGNVDTQPSQRQVVLNYSVAFAFRRHLYIVAL